MIGTNNNSKPSNMEIGRIEGLPGELQASGLNASRAEVDFAIRAGGVEPPQLPSYRPKIDSGGRSPTSYPRGGNNPALQVGPSNIPNRRIMV